MANDDAVSSSHDGPMRHERRARRHRRTVNRDVGGSATDEARLAEALGGETWVSGGRFVESTPPWARVCSRLFASVLDVKLASGQSPDSSPLLMARARSLVSMPVRRNIAQWWLDLLLQARSPLVSMDSRVPIVRDRVILVQTQICELANALVAPLATVRGVAMADSLLTDGAGPIYNEANDVDLANALRDVIRQIDPAA